MQDDRERVIGVRNLIIEVFAANGNLIDTGNRLTQPLGITSALWQVLGALGFAEEPLSVPQIATRMGLTRQSVQRNVDILIERSLVTRVPNPRHRRSNLMTLTEEGRLALERVDERHRPLSARIAIAIGDDRIADALSVLRQMNTILDEASAAIDEQGVAA